MKKLLIILLGLVYISCTKPSTENEILPKVEKRYSILGKWKNVTSNNVNYITITKDSIYQYSIDVRTNRNNWSDTNYYYGHKDDSIKFVSSVATYTILCYSPDTNTLLFYTSRYNRNVK